MKWILIVAVLAGLGQKVGQAAPLDVSLEWIELDCTKCPELVARFRGAAVQKCDASLADLEKKAGKRVLIHNYETIEPGTTVKHATRIDETTLRLELTIRSADQGAFLADVDASIEEGPERVELKPGTQATPEQLTGIDKSQTAFHQLRLLPGESCCVGGLATRKPVPEKRTIWDALTGTADAKKANGPTIRILVVGVKGTRSAKAAPKAAATYTDPYGNPSTNPPTNPYGGIRRLPRRLHPRLFGRHRPH